MKKVDIRKIYICEIAKQGAVKKISDDRLVFGCDTHFKWDYEKGGEYGLFTLVLGAYKHILTDTIYPRASYKTGNKIVVKPDNIELFVRKEREISSHLINKYGSFNMGMDVIKLLEERINSDRTAENTEFSL